ncbi:glycosyltransferase [Arthrobacter sp. zg-Y411]|uniref:glycosyltransferase family 2 protein n=1 Tax=Arthrobacter zhangbolii TaxID=2886936 RepID=UPI001D1463BD|nr:glycosyltransferase family 2 protein [Arthrobacter zhangbolii]MCC3294808.1 glycosyltransferase [Arthrobacter zhangbolii]
MPAVDVLLPYWGDPELLKTAAESVLAQTFTDYKLTVIDDAYPDPEAGRWLTAMDDPRIEYLRNAENLGVNANFTKALGLATAPVFVMMGSDDVMLSNYLETVMALMDAFPAAAVVQPGVIPIDSDGIPSRSLPDRIKRLAAPKAREARLLQGEMLAASLLRAGWHYFPSLAWRRDVVIPFGFRPEYDVVQDLALLLDVAASGAGMAVSEEPVFHYRRHAGSDSSQRAHDGRRFNEERRFFAAEADRFAALEWPRAARAARLHWTSRLHALSVIPGAISSGSFRTVLPLARHVVH